MHRTLAMLGLIALLVGCGSDSTGPDTGTLNVRFDAQTCTSGTAEIFVDGTSVGAFLWASGQSRDFSVEAGQHSVGASSSNFTWPAQLVTVPKDGTFNAIFTC